MSKCGANQSWHALFVYWDTCHFYVRVDKRLNFKYIEYYYLISSSIYKILFHAKLIQRNDIDNFTINMVTNIQLNTNVRDKIEIFFYYGIVVTLQTNS